MDIGFCFCLLQFLSIERLVRKVFVKDRQESRSMFISEDGQLPGEEQVFINNKQKCLAFSLF